ncbi:hypothetical protein [Methanobrevibacter sp.]|uniref:hypothetical protein n=1 Tax=Methanobrevibacter sp. TaxID=66852 RepID=UPI00386A6AFF
MKNKLLCVLLLLVFVVSIGAVVAEDAADVSEELAIDNGDEDIAVTEDPDDVLAVDEEEQPLQVGEDAETAGAAADAEDLTDISIKVDVLDKNIKAGDEFRVKVTVTNDGNNPAENVVAGFAFIDLLEDPDPSFQLVDDNGYAVYPYDGGFIVEFGFLDVGESQDVILTFLATESGEKMIVAGVGADNSDINYPGSYYNTTITVGESSNPSNNKDKVSSAKTASTGNPLALLGLALCGLVPYYRRD